MHEVFSFTYTFVSVAFRDPGRLPIHRKQNPVVIWCDDEHMARWMKLFQGSYNLKRQNLLYNSFFILFFRLVFIGVDPTNVQSGGPEDTVCHSPVLSKSTPNIVP